MESVSITEENYLKAIFKISETEGDPVRNKAISEAMETTAASVTDMLRRLKENGLIHFYESMSIFLAFLISGIDSKEDFDDALDFYTELYLPFSDSVDSQLLLELLEVGSREHGEGFFNTYLSRILLVIDSRCFEKYRRELLSITKKYVEKYGLEI